MRYVKKLIPIEAVKLPVVFNEENFKKESPKWLLEACLTGSAIKTPEGFLLKTLEGEMLAPWGSYVVKGVRGELYCCQADIFEETYDEYYG